MSKYTLEEMFNFIVDYTDVTEDALILIIKMLGNSKETMLKVLYTATGWRNFNQMFDYMGVDYNE